MNRNDEANELSVAMETSQVGRNDPSTQGAEDTMHTEPTAESVAEEDAVGDAADDEDTCEPESGSSGGSGSGVRFPAERVKRLIEKNKNRGVRTSAGSPTYLSAILEYLAKQALDEYGDGHEVPRHIQLAVRSDEELNKLFNGVVVAQGGVLPNIHAVLVPRPPQQAQRAEVQSGVVHPAPTDQVQINGPSTASYTEEIRDETES
jgi:histone H2A